MNIGGKIPLNAVVYIEVTLTHLAEFSTRVRDIISMGYGQS